MNFRKRSLILILISVLLLCGCGRQAETVTEPVSPTPAPTVPPTPAPTADPYEQLMGSIVISEAMSKNRSTVLSAEGSFADWVELENRSGNALDLEGWTLSDDENEGWALPAMTLGSGERLLLFTDKADFSLSENESVYLKSPTGLLMDCLPLMSHEADVATVRNADGTVSATSWASPGYNSYEDFMAGKETASPLVINEVCPYRGENKADWIELKNVSDSVVNLADYYLSDDDSDYLLWQLPEKKLQPGAAVLIYCTDEDDVHADPAPFSLGADREQLYLSNADRQLMDYVNIHHLPLFGSVGRMDGQNGFFLFENTSPERDNAGGVRRMAEAPVALTKDGVFNDVSSVTLELSAKGRIYYTQDGSLPTAASSVYTGPISVSETSVIRAISVEEGALPSVPITLSYIINENHSLPVVSVATDNLRDFRIMYGSSNKEVDLPANVAYYETDGGGFNQRCLLSMKGWTSLELDKKSMGVEFKSALGGELEYDLFGNGITTFSSLSIRAGQDYLGAIIRNELFQELCLDLEGAALTQESQYCALYINGEYRGLYCLKEDFSKQYYASHANVSKDSVEYLRTPVARSTDFFTQVHEYSWQQPMSDPECYAELCRRVDIDSLIDWFIMEGYCANTDVQGNTKLFRSPENGNKYVFAFYDLDWGFRARNSYAIVYYGQANNGHQIPLILRNLSYSEEFRTQFLSRFSEVIDTVLSNEHVLAKIDELVAEIEAEVPRDRERWGLSVETWERNVEALKEFVIEPNYEVVCIDYVCEIFSLTEEERMQWFGR